MGTTIDRNMQNWGTAKTDKSGFSGEAWQGQEKKFFLSSQLPHSLSNGGRDGKSVLLPIKKENFL